MARAAKVIGYAPVYETDRGFQIRRDEIRPANNSRYNGYDDDDFGDDDDDDFGDDDDDFGEDDVDFAGPRRDGRRERRGNRRDTRRANSDDRRGTRYRNQDRREATREANRESRRGGGSCSTKNGSTNEAVKMLSGSNTATGSGVASTITIRPQYDFIADDITFVGADTGAEISAIYFGATPVWSVDAPIALSIFATTSFKNRGILRGARIRGGLDIIIHYVSGAASKLTAVITGEEA